MFKFNIVKSLLLVCFTMLLVTACAVAPSVPADTSDASADDKLEFVHGNADDEFETPTIMLKKGDQELALFTLDEIVSADMCASREIPQNQGGGRVIAYVDNQGNIRAEYRNDPENLPVCTTITILEEQFVVGTSEGGETFWLTELTDTNPCKSGKKNQLFWMMERYIDEESGEAWYLPSISDQPLTCPEAPVTQ